jgi:hypothetical protein
MDRVAMRAPVVALVLALALPLTVAGTRDARADGPGFSIGSRPVWYVTAGGTGGGTVAGTARSGFVGGEVSLVRLREARFLGLYADAFYDFGVDGTYLTIGPELGWIRRSPTFPIGFGVDGGAAFRFADERAVGATGRVFVDFTGTFAIYARYAYLDAAEDDHLVQLGVTLKFPLGPPFGAATRR